MEFKEKFANPPREYFPYILWQLEEIAPTSDLSSILSFYKNLCCGIILQAFPKQKDIVKKICILAKEFKIPIYLVLPPLSLFPSYLQATRVSIRQGGMIELPIKGNPIWIGAVSFQSPTQPTIINLEQFVQGGILRWSAPSGNWETLIISSLPFEKKENTAETAIFWMEELSDFTPPLAGFFIPNVQLHPFPWRDDLLEEFQRRRGFPLGPHLPSLAMDLDERSGKLRYDYRRTVYEMLKEGIEGIQNIVKRKGLVLLASPDIKEHCWGEIYLLAPNFSTYVFKPSGNPFLDELLNTLLSSFSSLSYIDIKHSAPPEEIKNQVDQLAAFGIRGSIFSFPLGTFPWNELLFPPIASYQARINFLLSLFPRNKRTALLLPRLSLWSHQKLGEDDEYFRAIERDLFYLCELLHKIHYDFILVDEDDLLNLSQLQTVILPSMTTIKRSTLNWLERFYEGGGNLVALGMLPFRSEEGVDKNLQNDARSLFKVNIEDINNLYILSSTMELGSGVTYAIGRIHPLSQGKIYSYQPAINPDRKEALRQTRQILRNCLPPDLDSLQEDIICHPREDKLFLILNRGEKPAILNAMLPSQGLPYEMQPGTGKSNKIMVYSLMEDGRIIIPLELHPRVLKILLIEEGEELHIDQCNFLVEQVKREENRVDVVGWQKSPEPPFAVIEIKGERKFVECPPIPLLPSIPLPLEWEIKLENPNVLPLKRWRFQKKTSWLSRFVPPKRFQESWPFVHTDYKPEGETWYQATFFLREMVENIFLCTEYPPEDILLNGRRLKREEKISLREYLSEGLNFLTLLINHNKYPFIPKILLKGDFSLYPIEGEWAIGKLKSNLQIGSWGEQGFPFYVGTIDYIGRFSLPSLYVGKRAILSLSQVKEMLEVEVNGEKMGFLFSPPWQLEIEKALNEGENELVLKITNCPPPSLGEQVRPSGLLGTAQILILNKISLSLPL